MLPCQYYPKIILKVEQPSTQNLYKARCFRCHEYAKLMIERLGKFREGFEQYKKNCYEYEAGASCHSAGHMLLQGIELPDGSSPVRT